MNLFIIIFPAVIALVGAILGTVITHSLYFRRWKFERIEGYKAEVFKAKLEVYRELVGLYVEFVFKLAYNIRDDTFIVNTFETHYVPVDKFIQKNAFLISIPVKAIAIKDLSKDIILEKKPEVKSSIVVTNSLALSKACETELGIKAISNDIEKMFAVINDERKKGEKDANAQT